MWVQGHSGVQGNEEADRRAGREVYLGSPTAQPDIATPAGIRQAYPIHPKSKHLNWNRQSFFLFLKTHYVHVVP